MKSLITTLILSLGIVSLIIAQEVVISPAPSWVIDISSMHDRNSKKDFDGGIRYLLVDNQVNIISHEAFSRQIFEILNTDGINANSDIKVVFDPKFQSLHFHSVKILRGNETLNKLSVNGINTFQRESEMERNLYDGSYTSVINLKDVRVGDIIEYAFTISGFNPIYNGHFYDKGHLQYSIPVDKIFKRVLSSKPLNTVLQGGAPPPTIKQADGKYEYSWEIENQEPRLLDSNVPPWHEPYQIVELSNFSSWAEVVSWAMPLYQNPDDSFNGVEKIKQITKGMVDEERTVLEIIRFVQDEIRYLGFEAGMGAYRPNSPSDVFSHRYGDCKDKVYLLVSLLKDIGINAYPTYVNSVFGQKLLEVLPSPRVFDHVIVMIEYLGNTYYIDPTITFQGGDLAGNYCPDYGYGLIIKPGNSELVKLPMPQHAITNSKELIIIENYIDKAKFAVRTEYNGSAADYQRRYHQSNDKANVQNEYLDFYSYLFPGIESDEAIKIYDYGRYSDNKFIVEENYSIEGLWKEKEPSGTIYFELYPILLDVYLNFQNSAKRTMPYYLGEPKTVIHQTIIEFPEEWFAEEKSNTIKGVGFNYESSINLDYNKLEISHSYQTDKGFIDAAEVENFIMQHQDIRDGLSFEVTYNQSLDGFRLSWIALIVAMIALIAGYFFAHKIYFKYDPRPWVYAENLSISSWLVLIGIGISLSPIRVLIETVSNPDFFNQNTWIILLSKYDFGQSLQLGILFMAELIYNCLYFVFGILIVILFFARRTSLPKLMIIYLSVNIASSLLDVYALYMISPELYEQSGPKQMFLRVLQAIVAGAIWIPYFIYSERVKSTFSKTLTL